MTNAVKKILNFATEEHKGQFRWKGEDYITHPIAVREIAIKIADDLFLADQYSGCFNEEIEIVAICHDISEDIKRWENKEDELINHIQNIVLADVSHTIQFDVIKTSLKVLNKNRYSSYLNFVLAAKYNFVARVVKEADITHNLIDSKKGSMKDKYELALYILQN